MLATLAVASAAIPSGGKTREARITLLTTNDMHSHLDGNGPDAMITPQVGDGDPVLGSAARLAGAIKAIRAEKAAACEPVLLVDAGDFSSGTLFHILSPSPVSLMAPDVTFLPLSVCPQLTPSSLPGQSHGARGRAVPHP